MGCMGTFKQHSIRFQRKILYSDFCCSFFLLVALISKALSEYFCWGKNKVYFPLQEDSPDYAPEVLEKMEAEVKEANAANVSLRKEIFSLKSKVTNFHCRLVKLSETIARPDRTALILRPDRIFTRKIVCAKNSVCGPKNLKVLNWTGPRRYRTGAITTVDSITPEFLASSKSIYFWYDPS